MQNYLKSTLKNIQKTLFLNASKWLFSIWRMQKKKEKQHQIKEGCYSWLEKKTGTVRIKLTHFYNFFHSVKPSYKR
jgi:hypothetical protein